MAALAVVGITVVVSDSDSSDHHQQQQRRRSANYEPTSWDYDSIVSQQDQDEEEGAADHHRRLQPPLEVISSFKDSVRRLLSVMMLQVQEEEDDVTRRNNSWRLIIRAIHQLQRLGIAYHFEQEMRGILMCMHQRLQLQRPLLDHDLPSAALLFTMLRQRGIPASTDMLMNALLSEEEEEEGKEKITDSDALVAVYQASYLGFPGETELDQARAFAVGKLLLLEARDLSSSLPLHWTSPRLQAMWSLSLIKDDDRAGVDDPAILQLARVDFNQVQAVHRRELAEVTRWWKESRLSSSSSSSSCSFARDRVVECFFCAACIAPEPRLAECREVLAKTGALIVHLDDIYDVYATLDELHAFTNAIATATWWEEHGDGDGDGDSDDDAVLLLPDYMKPIYSAIKTTSVAAAQRVRHKHGYDMLPLYKKAWHDLCQAFLVEAQWQQQGHMPSFAEYVSNGWVTSTGPLLLLHALPAAGVIPITTAETTQANNGDVAAAAGMDYVYPRLVELSSIIFRLCNDCAESSSERGDAPSSIACCMAEPWCAGEDQARAAVHGVIADTWKLLNREVAASAGSSTMAMAATLCLNLARIIHCIYHDGDGITSPTHRIKQMVNDLLFNPISVDLGERKM